MATGDLLLSFDSRQRETELTYECVTLADDVQSRHRERPVLCTSDKVACHRT